MSNPSYQHQLVTIKVKTKDGHIHEVNQVQFDRASTKIHSIVSVEHFSRDTPIEIDVESRFLPYLIDWVQFMDEHSYLPDSDAKKNQYRADFWDPSDQDMLFGLTMAADELGIRNLLESGCQNIGELLRGKGPEQLRELLGLEDDFTDEQREQNRRIFSFADTSGTQ
eukprot:gnl/Dysnectes_brevis/2886_a3525_726.p3 GENE.gnl/Dysnectes_brevis/2886_a3525_726~~gnl/Dysnectes_brevis/2886_a3525_726.p3  ORF type:complete len:167 (+),score=31.03 gnl/Dysnectes_brevis/2886_a3525_726:1337-1837(+)